MGNLYLRYNGLSSPVSVRNTRLYSFSQTPRSMKKNYMKSISFAQSLQKSQKIERDEERGKDF